MEKNVLLARHRRILHILNGKYEEMTSKELSGRLKISERTIRNDIKEINHRLAKSGIAILAMPGKGYRLRIDDRERFHALLSENDNIQTGDDRVRYLILRLVWADEKVGLSDLEEEMYVSRSTLEKDLRDLRSRIVLLPPKIGLIRDGEWIALEADERKRRKILIHLYFETWDYDSRDGMTVSGDMIDNEKLQRLRVITKNILKKYSIRPDDYSMIYLILAIVVTVLRNQIPWEMSDLCGEYRAEPLSCGLRFAMKQGQGLPSRKRRERMHSEAVAELVSEVNELWSVKLSPVNVRYLSVLVRQLSYSSLSEPRIENALLETSSLAQCIAEKLMLKISERFSIDFRGDAVFYTELLYMIQMMPYSLYTVQVQNIHIYDELRQKYPLAGEAASFICEEIGKEYGIEPDRADEDALFLHLINAMRRLQKKKRKRVVLVSHLASGLTRYLEEDIRRILPDTADIIGPYPIYDRESIDAAAPDIIVSTVKMDVFREFEAPVLSVSPILTDTDRQRLYHMIKE